MSGWDSNNRVRRLVETQKKESLAAQYQIVTVHFPTANADVVVRHNLQPPDPEYVDFEVLNASGPPMVYVDKSPTRVAWGTGYVVLRSAVEGLKCEIRLSVSNIRPGERTPYEGSVTTLKMPILYATTGFFERGRTVAVGEWTSYTPVLDNTGGGASLGNGTIYGKYTLVGKTCTFHAYVNGGTTTNWGAGAGGILLSLPFTALSIAFLLQGAVLDAGVAWYEGVGIASSTTRVGIVRDNTGGYVGPNTPFVFGDSDRFIIHGTYEIA